MDIHVLGISGSPHRHGNTETLLDAFLEGAGSAGAGFEKVVISRLDYIPCRGCNVCHRTGRCVVDDDFRTVFERIMEVDVLAVASPIYSLGITSELKALVDRAQMLWAQQFILRRGSHTEEEIKRHKGVFISTAGQAWENVFDAAVPVVRTFFNVIGFEYYDNLLVRNLDAYGGVRYHPTAIGEARRKGEVAVRAVARLKAGPSGSERQ
ncbi:MAG: flavodoxin family protein [Methanoculleaceae archaeon]